MIVHHLCLKPIPSRSLPVSNVPKLHQRDLQSPTAPLSPRLYHRRTLPSHATTATIIAFAITTTTMTAADIAVTTPATTAANTSLASNLRPPVHKVIPQPMITAAAATTAGFGRVKSASDLLNRSCTVVAVVAFGQHSSHSGQSSHDAR